MAVLNGQVSYVQANQFAPYSAGTSAMLTCNSGFVPSGSSSAYCTNSQWSPTLGECEGSAWCVVGAGARLKFGVNGNKHTLNKKPLNIVTWFFMLCIIFKTSFSCLEYFKNSFFML